MLPPSPAFDGATLTRRLTFATLILLGIACVIYALTGCAPVAVDQRPAVMASVDGAVVAVAIVYEAEQRACPRETPAAEDACVDAVRARWAPAKAALLSASAAVRAAMGQP